MNIFGKEFLEDCEIIFIIKSKKRNIYFLGFVISYIIISRIKFNVLMVYIKIVVYLCIVFIISFNKFGKFMGIFFLYNFLIFILFYIFVLISFIRVMKCNIIFLFFVGS